MEQKQSSYHNTLPTNLVDFPLLHTIFELKPSIVSFFAKHWSLFNSIFHGNCKDLKSKNYDVHITPLTSTNKAKAGAEIEAENSDENCLYGRDIEMVMERLGFKNSLEEKIQKKWDYKEIFGLFEQEPSMEEVKEAFNVFDQNRDGLIDAGELQRVLIALGLRQGFELEECSKMIRPYDQNNDGKLDFNDFLSFLMKNFS